MAREANAKRARLNGKGRTAAAGLFNGLVKTSSRSSQSSDGTTMFMKVGGVYHVSYSFKVLLRHGI
jgi:hypothetical protein